MAFDLAFDEIRERYVDACDEVTNLTGKNDTVQNSQDDLFLRIDFEVDIVTFVYGFGH